MVVHRPPFEAWCQKYRHQCPLGVGRKLPLPFCADVRLHILMTHRNDRYSVIADGTCASGQDMSGAHDCFNSVSNLGINATSFTNKTISDPKAPSGCAVVVTDAAHGAATVTWNSASGAAPCLKLPTKVGQATSGVGVTVGLKTGMTGKLTMTRTAPGDWCNDNHNQANHANPTPFVAKSLASKTLPHRYF